MRQVLLAAILLLAACRREGATGAASAGGSGSAARAPIAAIPGHPSGVSDDELVAFTRWQRDYMDVLRRHMAELDAISQEYASRPLGSDTKEMEARVAELTAHHAPEMQALYDRVPLKGPKVELVTEAIGGIFHFDMQSKTYPLVVARDEMRLDADRRRFGPKVIDDIVAREALILAALQRP